jgi:hypothetical protein
MASGRVPKTVKTFIQVTMRRSVGRNKLERTTRLVLHASCSTVRGHRKADPAAIPRVSSIDLVYKVDELFCSGRFLNSSRSSQCVWLAHLGLPRDRAGASTTLHSSIPTTHDTSMNINHLSSMLGIRSVVSLQHYMIAGYSTCRRIARQDI